MLGIVGSDCGHTLIDLDGAIISGPFPCRSRKPWTVFKRRLSHLKTFLFYRSAFPSSAFVFFQTSLGRNALLRDLAYMRRCCRTGRAFSVFIHGWDERVAARLSASPRQRKKVAQLLNHANNIFVLAPAFAETLVRWGVDPQRAVVETTMIDDAILSGFDIHKKIAMQNRAERLKILFMGRVVKEKGIYQALEAYRIHKIKFPLSTFIIAGDGEELAAVRKMVDSQSILDVRFEGFVEGDRKIALLAEADVFLFPSFHGEGLPVSLLEAMAFGSTVISRPVGGIGHFFRVPEMGHLEAGLDPKKYAVLLDEVAENPKAWASTAKFNHEFSRKNVLASKVGRRIINEVTRDVE